MASQDKEHRKILREVLSEPAKKAPAKPLIITNITMVLLIIMLLAWLIPSYAFPPQAKPGNVPSLAEVLPSSTSMPLRPTTMNINEYIYAKEEIKLVASRVVSNTCSSNDPRCYADALFYFVRDNINYVNDPINEYYEMPQETLSGGTADCDGHAILLASLLQSVGIETRFVYRPRHVLLEAWLPSKSLFASEYAKEWVKYDPTCKSCRPGQE